uniref:Importin-13 n=1 Tax=Timema bartmani TaxID=61472 RepID=A0A7R9F8V7_9NEOP|nr:unnamed protein product [Timema bartmani]
MYCYNVLREDLLKLLHSKLEDALLKFDKDPSQWQPLESCLHAFLSVSECVQTSETDNLPKFLATLQKLPFQQLDVRVMSTVLDAIGNCVTRGSRVRAYAEWINGHPEVLTSVIPLLVMGLGTPQVAPLQVVLTTITLDFVQDALRCNQLKLSECVRLMYTVGRVLAVLPMENIMSYLNQMLMPYVEELHVLVTLEINTVTKLAILSRLKMLSMLFATLDVQGEGDISRFPQPVFLVLQRILPVIQAIVHVWCSDAQVIEVVCSVLKNAVATLLDQSLPLVADMTQILVKSYQLQPHPAALDLARQFVIMYGRNKSHVKLMQSLLCELSSITLHMTAPPHCQNISEYSDILEAFFNLLAQVLKKNAELLASAESLELEKLFQCGILALSVPEALTVKASSSFLVNFISQSTELALLFSVVQSNGESLTLRILRNIGGESPRSALEPLADLLLTMNKKHCDSLSRWLHTTICSEPQPLPRSTSLSERVVCQDGSQKDCANQTTVILSGRLVTRCHLLINLFFQATGECSGQMLSSADPDSRETTEVLSSNIPHIYVLFLERANKRKLQETVREFSLICRGLVGTEYAAKLSPYF